MYDAITTVRAIHTHDETLMEKATFLQDKHINPPFWNHASSTFEQADIDQQSDGLRNIFGNMCEQEGMACSRCDHFETLPVHHTRQKCKKCGCGGEVTKKALALIPVAEK